MPIPPPIAMNADDDDYTRTGYPGDGFEDEDGVGTGYMEDDQEEAILGSGSVEPDVEMVRGVELINMCTYATASLH